MTKYTNLTALIAIMGCSATPAMAEELTIGSTAPGITACTWVKKGPVDPTKPEGKQITVVEFWATWCGPCVAAVPHISELQRRHAKDNVRIVGVTKGEPNNTLELVKNFVRRKGDKMDYAVAFDKSGDVYRSYMDAAGQGGIPTAFVVDKSGLIAWIGHPEDGLDDVLSELVSGEFDIEIAKKLHNIDQRIERAHMDGDWDRAFAAADEAIAIKPPGISYRMMKFYGYAQWLDQIDDAVKTAKEAFEAAGDDPRGVATIASEVLSEGDMFQCNKMAAGALKKALQRAPRDPDVRMAYFQALSATGKNDEAMALATETLGTLRGDATKLNHFAKMLSSPANREKCGDLALRAVALAIEADPEEPAHHIAKFHILHECKNNKSAAIEAGQYAIQLAAGDATVLNEFAWGLLTELDTKGQFNELALAAADQLYNAPGGDEWGQLDTIALAKFENGAVDEAIKIEKRAIEKCESDAAKASLAEALARFEAGTK